MDVGQLWLEQDIIVNILGVYQDPQLSLYRLIGKFGQIWPSWSLRSAQSLDKFDPLTL